MKLDDFLKCKKVRCVDDTGLCLTKSKEYQLVGVTNKSCLINCDDGYETWARIERFEPVLDPAENPLQNIELTPEFESAETVLVYNCEVNTQDNSVNTQDNSVNTQDNSVNTQDISVNIQDIGTDILDTNADIKDTPKFKVGDKVYAPSVGAKVYTLKDFGDGWVYPIRIDCDYDEDHEFTKEGQITAEGLPILFLATELNHSLLSQFYGIDFERPPLTGNELCRKLLDKGEKYIMAKDEHDTWRIICDYCDDWFTDVVSGKCLKNVTPLNSKGEPLTESVLDE